MQRNLYFGIFLCLTVTTIFSFHYVAAKFILSGSVSPYSLSAWRGMLGGGIILLLFRHKYNYQDVKQQFPLLFWVAFLGFFINQIFFMQGLKRTTPINTAIISNCIPIMMALTAILFRVETFSRRKLLGIFIAFVLVLSMVLRGESLSALQINLGDFFIFLNVLAFCIAFSLGKKLLTQDFPYELLTGAMLFGGGLMMSLLSNTQLFDLWTFAADNFKNFSYVVFEILISTSFVYLLNLKALSLMDPTKIAFFVFLQPIITAMIVFFSDGILPDTRLYWVFLGLAFSGYLVILSPNTENPAKTENS